MLQPQSHRRSQQPSAFISPGSPLSLTVLLSCSLSLSSSLVSLSSDLLILRWLLSATILSSRPATAGECRCAAVGGVEATGAQRGTSLRFAVLLLGAQAAV